MICRRWHTWLAGALAFLLALGLWTSDRTTRAPATMAPVADARPAPLRETVRFASWSLGWTSRPETEGKADSQWLNVKWISHAVIVTAPHEAVRHTPSAPRTSSAHATLVRVRAGECLWTIAETHHTTVAELVRLNRLRSTLLHVGQILRLPAQCHRPIALPKSPEASSPSCVPNLTYTVQPGDSLWEISNIFGVPVSAIRSANHLRTSAIYPGERLVIEPSRAFGGSQAQSVLLREAPAWLIPVYKAAGAKYDIPWTVLAAIHKVETDFSTDGDIESYAGAIGPMQFLPSTFAIFGVPAPGHRTADIHNVEDAIYSAAHMLHQEGFSLDPYYAIWTYNHSATYVKDVLHLAVT